ncbi:MAG: hypothetical protein Kow00124_31020 [Anaerolineae bacterium]
MTGKETSHISHHTPTAGANPRKIEGTPLDPAWIKVRTNEELVGLLYEISRELKSRLVRETEEVFWVAAPESFQTLTSDDAFEFVRLPARSTRSADEARETTWRIVLIGSKPEHRPIAVEIFDDVTIGRKVEGAAAPDIDLTDYDADRLGVSREHALLRPTRDGLLLNDLGSTNGTFCDTERVRLGAPQLVKDHSVISFGGLHFKVRIVSQPG